MPITKSSCASVGRPVAAIAGMARKRGCAAPPPRIVFRIGLRTKGKEDVIVVSQGGIKLGIMVASCSFRTCQRPGTSGAFRGSALKKCLNYRHSLRNALSKCRTRRWIRDPPRGRAGNSPSRPRQCRRQTGAPRSLQPAGAVILRPYCNCQRGLFARASDTMESETRNPFFLAQAAQEGCRVEKQVLVQCNQQLH
jgi:hypothetical protein